MSMSGNELRLLNAVRQLQEIKKAEHLIENLDDIFDEVIVGDSYSNLDRLQKAEWVATYRGLREFLILISEE